MSLFQFNVKLIIVHKLVLMAITSNFGDFFWMICLKLISALVGFIVHRAYSGPRGYWFYNVALLILELKIGGLTPVSKSANRVMHDQFTWTALNVGDINLLILNFNRNR